MRSLLAFALLALAPPAFGDEKNFTPLFDGKSLDGWTFIVKPDKNGKRADPKTTWSVQDGTVRCTGKPNGCMVTKGEYGDYVLKVKWRFPPGRGGNTGVLLHVQDDKYWPTSIEAQMLSGHAGDLFLNLPPAVKLDADQSRRDPKQPRRLVRIEPKEPVEKPLGEWNEMEVTCKGGDITVVVNGVRVNAGKNGNLSRGRVALQSEGAEVYFKDIVIKGLK
jgi:hypothetical protein